MRVRLERRDAGDDTIAFGARAACAAPIARLTYRTRTGALLRVDGAVAGAFDGKHATIDVPWKPGEHELTLTVERRALPIAGLPAGDGVRWRLMLARAAETPRETIEIVASPAVYGALAGAVAHEPPMVGHAHLDVAWLWTNADARRKAARTFATALRQLELDDRFVFAQSQPQLYAWVAADEPALFARVCERIGEGWDASVASMWVEPDLHAISGESILRQFLYGMRFARERLGTDPRVVWLPDTFGFPSTLPTLAVHAGLHAFATAKLQWNETTRWPHPQFCWYGDDGSCLVSAVLDRYDGPATRARADIASERRELLVHGYGDGGGGVTDEELRDADRATRPWCDVASWFDGVELRVLPAWRGELYLETHRGTYTTHRDVKSRNAALERALGEAEELVAWCAAVRAPASAVKPLAEDLRNAWPLVLKNQFHDVIAGTAVAAVYGDAHADYDRAERIVERVAAGARSILPRADLVLRAVPVPPVEDEHGFAFANAYVSARVKRDGTLVELRGVDGPDLVSIANGLMMYVDTPRRWDAWNLDASYERHPKRLTPGAARVVDDALEIELAGHGAAIVMRVALNEGEPYVRFELTVRWSATHRILRAEHRFAIDAREACFGQPHGTLVRTAAPQTPAERTRFEVPAQRFVHVTDGTHGAAIFAPDTYGWSAFALRRGGIRVGMSLLRAPAWPDPSADRGDRTIAYAIAPTAGATTGDLEAAWRDYAEPDRVRLFTCDDPAVLVVATKPADDGDGVIVRVRECDGSGRRVDLICGGRMRAAECVDACERPIAGEVAVDGERLGFMLPAFALRSFRIRP